MIVTALTIGQTAEAFGLAAAAIAVFGFLAHSPRALRGRDETSLRKATVVGGLLGFMFASFVVVLSVLGVT
jgi:hypothetical protein